MFNHFKKKELWFGLLIIIGLLVVIQLNSYSHQNISFAEKTVRIIFTPLQKSVVFIQDKLAANQYLLSSKKNMQQEMLALQKRYNELSLENQKLLEYEAEAKRLRSLLEFRDQNIEHFTLQSCRVIARSPNNWYQTITIDAGVEDGIEKNMPVINPDGLVGCVAAVSDKTAQVYLITDREIAVGAILQENRDTKGIVEGRADSNSLRMVNIPYYSEAKPGETVVTSGLSEIYPKGIKIGQIEDVTREENGLLLLANVKPAVNFDRLEEVMVIKKYNSLPQD
jgi:rod shape-determining protein MreC